MRKVDIVNKLSYDEFCNLSYEEKCKRWTELPKGMQKKAVLEYIDIPLPVTVGYIKVSPKERAWGRKMIEDMQKRNKNK
jgi:hypothetical protein